jgi:hypothetical protein
MIKRNFFSVNQALSDFRFIILYPALQILSYSYIHVQKETDMIDSYTFGEIVIDGQPYTNDVIIYPDHVDGSWWRKKGHNLVPDDIRDVLQYGPDTLIVGNGASGVMKVPEDTKDVIRNKGIELIVERTGRAVEEYNRRKDQQRVVAALHLTC